MFGSGQLLQYGIPPSCDDNYDQMMGPAQYKFQYQYDPRLSNINACYAQQTQSPQLNYQPNGNQTPASQTSHLQQYYYYPEDQSPSLPSQAQYPHSTAQSGPQQQQQQQNLYFCLWEPCGSQGRGFVRQADLERHLNSVHNRESRYECPVRGCTRTRAGKGGFPRKDKMIEHLREVHKVPVPKRGSAKNSPS